MERKDRIQVEHKALDMIKTAKQKWESSERSKVENMSLELEQQKEKIAQLTATNGLLNEQLQHALQLKNKPTVSTSVYCLEVVYLLVQGWSKVWEL